ncbi:DUF1275 domain-containing protein [Antrihabitans sp. YC3-6]|uniref:DUF1275 domain-containing protein n=1 Tax=Antrihabitans stalagmiti TaxID=2799499 RepID=A0A934NSY3_9NOCA|nr:YoaK family protein [Antrihabitans stalagmiti]MBJ8340722.1 DUF1275 domain-containing protein [Antrihabitans stalagmiti]
MLDHDRREMALAAMLSGVAGFVDAIGFLHFGGYFVSFMSGNTTQAGVSLAEGDFRDFGLAIGLIVAFFVGVVIGSQASRRVRERRWLVLAIVASILTTAAVFHHVPFVAFLAPPLMAVAMGAQNSVFERDGQATIGLTFVTGTLVKLGQSVSRLIDGERSVVGLRYFALWSGLAAGTVVGAVTYLWIGLSALWFAAALTAFGTAALRRMGTVT